MKYIIETSDQFQSALKVVEARDRILLKSGVYQHEEYNTSWETRTRGNAFFASGLKGTAEAPIKIMPFGDGPVTIVSDVNGLAIKDSKYIIIEGIEFVGPNSNLSAEQVLEIWWHDDPMMITGRGIALNRCSNIDITRCRVHDFPGAGISSKHGYDISIYDNAIYNNCWFSISGSHGIANSEPKGPSGSSMKIYRNLVFGNQCCVISRVFSKGYVTLALDEGNGIHFQNDEKMYRGGLLIKENISVFNGKAGIGLNRVSTNQLDSAIIKDNLLAGNCITTDSGQLSERESQVSFIRNILGGEPYVKSIGLSASNYASNIKTPEFTSLSDLLPPEGTDLRDTFTNILSQFSMFVAPCDQEINLESMIKTIKDTQPADMAHIEFIEHC